jgi:hypothetical protein
MIHGPMTLPESPQGLTANSPQNSALNDMENPTPCPLNILPCGVCEVSLPLAKTRMESQSQKTCLLLPLVGVIPQLGQPNKPATLAQQSLHNYPLQSTFCSLYTIQDEIGSGGFGFVVTVSILIDIFIE